MVGEYARRDEVCICTVGQAAGQECCDGIIGGTGIGGVEEAIGWVDNWWVGFGVPAPKANKEEESRNKVRAASSTPRGRDVHVHNSTPSASNGAS